MTLKKTARDLDKKAAKRAMPPKRGKTATPPKMTTPAGRQAQPAERGPSMADVKQTILGKLRAPSKIPAKSFMEAREDAIGDVKLGKDKRRAKPVAGYVKTGIDGFDDLFEKGIPKHSNILVCGGPGSGKTIFCLQAAYEAAKNGEKCLYITFEEPETRLREHMKDFGWDPAPFEKRGNLLITRMSPYDITTQVEAMAEKLRGDLLIDLEPVLFPGKFKPTFVFIDSLTAIESFFVGKEENFRVYVEQLFRLFESTECTSFLISEKVTESVAGPSGVEDFLADGVILLYNIQHGNIRESAIEVLKMRGASFKKHIVAMKIVDSKGITVFPEQELFEEIQS